MGHYLRPHHPRSCHGSHPTAANKQSHHAAAKRSSHQVWRPTPQPGQPTPHSQPTTAGGSRSSHWLLTRHLGPAATQPHQPHPTLPPAPSTFHAHPPHPIHRPRRGHLCNRPHPHHPPFRIPVQHPSLTTMAQPSPPAPHFTPYHYHNFLSSNSVYIKLHFNPDQPQRCYHQHGHFYVGSTAIGIPHREHNRRAKLKQLQNNIPISAELSLRYWHSHNNIHHYTTIQLTSHDTYDQAWIQEHHYIANWMPSLNWPFISHHLKLKAQGWQFAKHRAHFYSRLATHKRLFRRLRQRQYTLREPHLYTSTKHHALQLLRNLTKHTAASFEAAKQLRSGRHTDLEVYAIRRMAANLEEPGRSRALHILNKALIYRNLTPPKPNIPLTVPFLAHDDFTKHCQQWLRTTIQQHKHFTIPLHLPSHRLREAAHKTLRSHLHNHRTWEDTLHSPPDPADLPCARNHLRTILQDPVTPTINGHYILTLDQLQLPTHLSIFLNANMNSTYYPSKARYFLIFKTAYTKWLKLQGLPPSLVQHLQPFLAPMAPSQHTPQAATPFYGPPASSTPRTFG